MHIEKQMRRSEATALDGHLFLVKHLLTLREQLAPFDMQVVNTPHMTSQSQYSEVRVLVLTTL